MNFEYNQNAAVAADSGGKYVTESCVVRCRIDLAKWASSQSSSAKALELSVTTEDGQQANFLSIWHTKSDGSPNDIGHNQINSLMGVTGVKKLSSVTRGDLLVCPELENKPVMLALERENYIKNDGSEGFKFQIKAFMSAQSGRTVAEHVNDEPAKSVEYWRERFAKNPQGSPPKGRAAPAQASTGYAPPPAGDDFDDDIPF